MQDRPRRTMSSRDAAEAMFKAATKPVAPPLPELKKPAVPGAKELLQETLDQEEATDQALTELAESVVNQEAQAEAA